MRRRVAAATLVALVLVPAAAAKGPVDLELCGASGCATVPAGGDGDVGVAVISAETEPSLDALVSAPAAAPYFEVRLRADWFDADPAWYVPSAGVLRVGASWIRLDARTAGALEEAVGSLAPWPAPRLAGAAVAGREVADAEPYAALAGPLPPAEWPAEAGRRVEISLVFERPGPWGPARLEYLPAHGLLWRDTDLWRVPEPLVRTLASDLAGPARAAPGRYGSGGTDWVAGLGVAATALLGAGLAVRRSARRAGAAGRPGLGS